MIKKDESLDINTDVSINISVKDLNSINNILEFDSLAQSKNLKSVD